MPTGAEAASVGALRYKKAMGKPILALLLSLFLAPLACKQDVAPREVVAVEQVPAAPAAAAAAPAAAVAPAVLAAPAVPAASVAAKAPAAPAAAKGGTRVTVSITGEGFVPARIPAKTGVPVTLVITRKTDKTCAREILFMGQEGKTELPLGKTVEVTYTPKASGEIKFGCAMGMMVSGVLAVAD